MTVDNDDDTSLPGWIYSDPEFFEVEKRAVFRSAWQVVCHVNDIPQAGDYHRFDMLDESVISVRGEDGAVRSFHNVCRHRASRLLDASKGQCGRRITCPYHAWTYSTDGRLVAIPQRDSYPNVKLESLGLVPVEQEIYRGFVFVRFAKGGPSVAEMAAPYARELAAYHLEGLLPLGRVTLRPRAVNWKNVADNYSDGMHITVAHPGLTRLFGDSYRIEAQPWIDRMSGKLRELPSHNLSERLYQRLLPEAEHPPLEHRRQWNYFKLWPNTAFDIYPDQIDFMQFLPVAPGQTLIRESAYGWPDERRAMRAVRYLNWRINRQVSREDQALIERVQAGMGSMSFTSGPLGETEVCLRAFARRMRGLIPECRQAQAPSRGWSDKYI
jgi:carnitine monooxygenase subunit